MEVGDWAAAIVVTDAAVWVENRTDETLSKIDPTTTTVVETVTMPDGSFGLQLCGDSMWVADGEGRLYALDPETGTATRSIEVPEVSLMVCEESTAWMFGGRGGDADGDGSATSEEVDAMFDAETGLPIGVAYRVDLDTGDVLQETEFRGVVPGAPVLGADDYWFSDGVYAARIDLPSAEVTARSSLADIDDELSGSLQLHTATNGGLWATDDNSVWRIAPDLSAADLVTTIDGLDSNLIVVARQLWVTASGSIDDDFASEALRLDPDSGEIMDRVPLRTFPHQPVGGFESIWVPNDQQVTRIWLD